MKFFYYLILSLIAFVILAVAYGVGHKAAEKECEEKPVVYKIDTEYVRFLNERIDSLLLENDKILQCYFREVEENIELRGEKRKPLDVDRAMYKRKNKTRPEDLYDPEEGL